MIFPGLCKVKIDAVWNQKYGKCLHEKLKNDYSRRHIAIPVGLSRCPELIQSLYGDFFQMETLRCALIRLTHGLWRCATCSSSSKSK